MTNTKNNSRLKETNRGVTSRPHPVAEKMCATMGITGTRDKTEYGLKVGVKNVTMLNFLSLVTVRWLCKKTTSS